MEQRRVQRGVKVRPSDEGGGGGGRVIRRNGE